MPPLDPAARVLRARLAAYAMHSRHPIEATTAAGRAAADRRFYDQVDPGRTLPEPERERRAAAARRAHMLALSYRSAKARREVVEEVDEPLPLPMHRSRAAVRAAEARNDLDATRSTWPAPLDRDKDDRNPVIDPAIAEQLPDVDETITPVNATVTDPGTGRRWLRIKTGHGIGGSAWQPVEGEA
jgi:hypothetical protein